MRIALRSPHFSSYTGALGPNKFANGFSEDIGHHEYNRIKSLISVELSYKEPSFEKNLPESLSVPEGDSIELSVKVNGGGCTYQWVKDGASIKGGNKPTLVIEQSSAVDIGVYVVVVNNPYGTVISESCSVSVA